jgi:hypothetical protein
MNVISIVPRLPPSIDGVGDYALVIARGLKDSYGFSTTFIVCDPLCNSPDEIDGFKIKKLNKRSKADILFHLNSVESPVFLHLSGYGYAKWSLYYWLVSALAEWKCSSPSTNRLLTMFHETYNCLGKPWQQHFWTASSQKRLALKIAHLSDTCVTNSTGNKRDITNFYNKDIFVLPVVSTIGEPRSDIKPLISRKRQIVVFGQSWGREESYVKTGDCINRFCELFDIQRVVDIGPSITIKPEEYINVPITSLGKLPASEICETLSESIAGWSSYNSSRLGKSSVLAAYASHGTAPIFRVDYPEDIDGLISGYNYVHPEIGSINLLACESLESLQSIASNAFDWYQSHKKYDQVRYFAQALSSLCQ